MEETGRKDGISSILDAGDVVDAFAVANKKDVCLAHDEKPCLRQESLRRSSYMAVEGIQCIFGVNSVCIWSFDKML